MCVAWIDDTVLKAHDETARFVPMVPKMQALAVTEIEKFASKIKLLKNYRIAEDPFNSSTVVFYGLT